jgi:hypothetical protein
VLVFGASLSTSAQGNSRWGRSHNRGRHLGWERGRRVGQHRRDDNNQWRWRRHMRRERRDDRLQHRLERRSNWNNNRNWQSSRNWRRRN